MNGDAKWEKRIDELMEAVDKIHSAAGAGDGQAVSDADRRYFLDFGPRDGGDGPNRARQGEGRRGSGDRGIPGHAEEGVTGVEMFRKLLDEGQAGDNVGLLLRGTEKDEVERGQVWRSRDRSRRTRSSRRRRTY